MTEKNFFSLGIASLCIHLGPGEKPPSPIHHLLHPSCLPLSPRWGHFPETENLEQGYLQAGLSSPFRATPSMQLKTALAVCKHTHVPATYKKYMIIPPERNAGVTVSACSSLSLLCLCRTPKSKNIRKEQPPFQSHPSCMATVGPTPDKRRSSEAMLW